MRATLSLAASLFAVTLGHGALQAADGPDATVAGWISSVKNNDVAAFYTALPAARQTELAEGWKSMAGEPGQQQPGNGQPPQGPGNQGQGQGQGNPGQGRRGGRNMLGMMINQPLQSLKDPESAKTVAQTLAGVLAQFAVVTQPATAAAPAMPAPPEGQPWMQFMQRGLAQGGLNSVVHGVLASGLETRQFAALQALFDDYAAWAAKGLDDPAKQTAAAGHLVEIGTALKATNASELAAVELSEVLARCGTALPALKQALLAYGLDADAVLASATVTTESTASDHSVVLVSFTAFGKPHQIPLKLRQGTTGWELVADSPALRWMGNGGMMGGGMRGMGGPGGQGGRQRGQGQGGQGGQDVPPPPAPAPGGANF